MTTIDINAVDLDFLVTSLRTVRKGTIIFERGDKKVIAEASNAFKFLSDLYAQYHIYHEKCKIPFSD